jgi:DNA-binding XRE family transcriptional regulator
MVHAANYMKEGSKYYSLELYLAQVESDEVTLAFSEIEAILQDSLPASAYKRRAWWSNRKQGAVQAEAWMAAGYHVQIVDLEGQQVTFRKPGLVYIIRRERGTVLWNGELIKSLRFHMGLTQSEMAEKLGTRQQTISEWETGSYEPKRSTSKYLTIIAEQAGFKYE